MRTCRQDWPGTGSWLLQLQDELGCLIFSYLGTCFKQADATGQ